MNRPWSIAWAVLAALFMGSSLALAQPAPIAIGKNGDFELTRPARIGTTTLEPGHYRLRHQLQDGNHFLVVDRRGEARRGSMHQVTGPDKEIGRVPCQVITLDEKVRDTALYHRIDPDGTSVITQIRMRGERGGHVIALEPKAS